MAAKSKNEEKLYDILKDLEICMMTTVEPGGRLHTRPMAIQEPDQTGAIWFITDKTQSAAENVKANPQVSLGFSNARGRHVAVSGKAKLVGDRALIDAMYSEEMDAWFPKGRTDPNIVLIEVTPERGEYWDGGSSTVISALAYLKTKIVGGDGDDLIDHAKVLMKKKGASR